MREEPIQLRPASNADAPAVRKLVFAVLREYGLAADPDGTDADLNDIEASYHARGGRFDVPQLGDGRTVGTVGLYRADDRTMELRLNSTERILNSKYDPSLEGGATGRWRVISTNDIYRIHALLSGVQ